jgi:magnesium-transporting ATPase (P-type)
MIITTIEMPYYLTVFMDISNIVSAMITIPSKEIIDSEMKTPLESPKGSFRKNFRTFRNRLASMCSSNSSNRPSTPTAMDNILNPLHMATEKRLDQFIETEKEELLAQTKNNLYKEDSISYGASSINFDKNLVRTRSHHSFSPPPNLLDRDLRKTTEEYMRIQSYNLDSLSVLGNVGEVIFSKTDILTVGSFRLKQLATRAKNYIFSNDDFKADMASYRSNPELFNQEDSFEDDIREEDENYSEKLQEYQSELDCDYNEKLMDSDDDLAEIMRKINYPRYLSESRTNLLFEVGDESAGINHPDNTAILANSKIEDLTSFYNLMKLSNSNQTQGQLIDKKGFEMTDLAKIIAGKFQKAITKSQNLSPKNDQPTKIINDKNLSGVIASQKIVSTRNISNNSKMPPKPNEEVISSKSIDDLINFSARNEENEPIKINFSKQHGVKSFISDLANKKHYLDDLINYLYLFQECSSMSKNKKHRNHTSTFEIKTALNDIFSEFGYRFKSGNKKKQEDLDIHDEHNLKPQSFFYNVKLENHYGVVSNYLIKLVNEYTNSRKRMSLIVCDKERNVDVNYLLVQGEEKYMRNCMNLNKKNKNMFKMLASRYKTAGNKALVIGIKILQREEVDEYINSFISILKSSRDQIQNLERLAISLESGLSFFGMIGVIDEVRPEAFFFCDSIKKAGIKMNLFTGDSLDQCLYIAKQLKFSDVDFTRSSDFFHLNFRDEARAHLDIKRVFETIFSTLKKSDISEKLLLKFDPQKQMSESIRKKIVNWIRHLKPNSTEESVDKLLKSPYSVPKKTLLVSGHAVSIIMKSKYLTHCLNAIVAMSDSLIVHSAQPAHFVFLIKSLRKRTSSAILAIGDGFNQFGILREADVSIQMQHPDVPLIFGDFLVKNFNSCHHLLFNKSFHIFKMNIVIIFIEFWRTLPYVFLMIGYLQTSEYSGFIANRFHLLTFYLSACLQILFCSLINTPYNNALGKFMPDFYLESKHAEVCSTQIFVILLIGSVIEASYMSIILWYFVSKELFPNGMPIYSIENLQDFTFLGVLIIGSFKNSFMARRRLWLTATINFCILGFCILLYFIYLSDRKSSIILRHQVIFIFTNSQMAIYLTFFCLVPIYLSFCMSIFFKALFIAPYSKVISRAYLSKDLKKEFTNQMESMRSSLAKKLFDLSIDEHISKIKSFFGRGVDFGQLEKIAFIDTFTNRSGITYFTNRIKEKGEAAKFRMLQLRSERRNTRRILGMVIVLLIILWGILLIRAPKPNYGFDTYVPITITVTCIPFAALFIKRNYEMVYRILKWSMISIISITVAFVIASSSTSTNSRFAISRMLFSNFPLDYPLSIGLGFICDTISFTE